MAEKLCAVSGLTTVTRHEVSRWERQQRIPGEFWLGWLADMLDCPVEQLESAATVTRRAGSRPETVPGQAGTNPGQARRDLLDLAHRWLVDPSDPSLGATGVGRAEAGPQRPDGTRLAESAGPGLDRGSPLDHAGLAELRRLDDVISGVELPPYLADLLKLPTVQGTRNRMLSLVAEAEQLKGWLAGDAGDSRAALAAYRRALAAATGAHDRPLAGHILGSASHLLVSTGEPQDALLLARTGYAGVRSAAPAGLRALLLHRVALAAARCGQRQVAQAALTAAERAAERRIPTQEPSWLYWLDAAEFAAMTGRCLAALRRPLRATPLLVAARGRTGQHRTSAIYGAWLAHSYVDLGELEQACRVADAALLDVVRAGSARAAAELAAVGRRLVPYRDEPQVRQHRTFVATIGPYLPVPLAADTGHASRAGRSRSRTRRADPLASWRDPSCSSASDRTRRPAPTG